MNVLDPIHLAGGGLDAHAPVSLAELLDHKARRLLAQAARDFGVGVHVTGLHGEALVGSSLPDTVTGAASAQLGPIDDGGRCYLAQVLLHEGNPIGHFAVGPFGAGGDGSLLRIATWLGHMMEHLLGSNLEKLHASRVHSATMEDAYAELQRKNESLAKAVERLQELDKIKSNFLATVSHELRTPLTSVIGYSEMLLEGIAGEMNDEQREYVKTVMEKGEQLLGIITQILDISRIEAGRVTLDWQAFPIQDIVELAVSTVLPTARRKNITVERELPLSLPPACGDRDKVRQVLVNLLGNAVKFTPTGGKITVRAAPGPLQPANLHGDGAEASGQGLWVSVTDTGIGIPPEAAAHVFEPFYQVDNSSTRSYGGTGLGLAIVRSFVEAHGGAVWVESKVGQGSTFFFTLPIGS